MDIRWVPYNGLVENIQSDLEMIMLYSSPTEGVSLVDINRYLADMSLVYAKLYSYKTKKLIGEIIDEIYRKNDQFLGVTLRNAFKNKQYIGLSKIEELLKEFMVPEID